MPSCAIITCRLRSQDTSIAQGGISFHRFPKDSDLKYKWVRRTGREFWIPTKTSTICSKHFTDDDFITKTSGNRFLRLGAVPSKKIVKVKSNSRTCCCHRHFDGILTTVRIRVVGKSIDISLYISSQCVMDLGKKTERIMTKCAVLHCKNYSNRSKDVSYHPFPNDPSRRKEWIKAIRRDRFWVPTKYHKICSKHFEAQCYNDQAKVRKLNKDAIPTLDLPGSITSNVATVTQCINCMQSTEVKAERLEAPVSPAYSLSGDSEETNVEENGKNGTLTTIAIDPLSPKNCFSPSESDSKTYKKKPSKKTKDKLLRKKLLIKEETCKGHMQKIYTLLKANQRLCQQNKNLKRTLINMKKKIAVLGRKNGSKSDDVDSSSSSSSSES